MKRFYIIFSLACALFSLQAYADCTTVITPSQAAAKAAANDPGTYCIEGYVVSTVDIYCKTNKYENQSFMMADEQGGEAVFEAWRVEGVDHTIGIGSKVRIVNATLSVWQGVKETNAGFTVELIDEVIPELDLPEYGSELTATDAAAYCLMLPYHDTETEDKYIVKGYATSVFVDPENEELYTVNISDTQDGGAVFQAWECYAIRSQAGNVMPIEEGDFVYVTGRLSRYNKNAQIKGGYIVTNTPIDPFIVRVSADADKGEAAVSGMYEFTLMDMTDVEFTLSATPAEGYEFVMWIYTLLVDPTRPSEATDLDVAETMLATYNQVKDLTGEDLQEFLEDNGMSEELFRAQCALLEKLQMPTATFNYDDLTLWIQMNMIENQHVFPFKAVFRSTGTGIEEVFGAQSSSPVAQKFLMGGTIYISLPDGKLYNMLGSRVK